MGRRLLHRVLFFLWVAGLPSTAFAQYFTAGSRIHGMGDAGMLLEDPWSSFYNQAGLAGIEKPVAAVCHERPYLLDELSVNSFVFVIPVRPGTITSSYATNGYPLWRESRAGLSFARKFGKRWSAGLQLDYFHTHIPSEEPVSPLFTFEFGILAEPVSNFLLGFHWFNPVRADYPESGNQRIPVIYTVAAGYRIDKKIILLAEAGKDILYPLSGKIGIEYSPGKNIQLRYGYNTIRGHSAGFGLRLKHFQIDTAFSKHPQLGYSPSLSMAYYFGS